MSETDLQRLKRLAEADKEKVQENPINPTYGYKEKAALAEALGPEAVLKLIKRIEKLRAALGEIRSITRDGEYVHHVASEVLK